MQLPVVAKQAGEDSEAFQLTVEHIEKCSNRTMIVHVVGHVGPFKYQSVIVIAVRNENSASRADPWDQLCKS